MFEHHTEERHNIYAYIINPKTIHEIDRITYWDGIAARHNKKAEALIESKKK